MTSWIDDLIKPAPEVLADFVLTGTGVYGPQTPGQSDIDIVLKFADVEALFKFLCEHDINWEAPNYERYKEGAATYFELGPLRFNIIVADEESFQWWRDQTERMKKFTPIEDRAERLRVFRGGEP